jgi:hypothetical protein
MAKRLVPSQEGLSCGVRVKDSAPWSYLIHEPGDIHISLQRLFMSLNFITDKFTCILVGIINLNFSQFHANDTMLGMGTIGL